ncbi:MAG: hypothetical protein J6K26_05910 [Lachnospiraceae bacterium]|nr:hypothetical protein [Lachnospiraceae bacterium]
MCGCIDSVYLKILVYWELKHGLLLGYTTVLLLSGALTVAAALISYYLVEKPSLRFSQYLVKKLKEKEAKRK